MVSSSGGAMKLTIVRLGSAKGCHQAVHTAAGRERLNSLKLLIELNQLIGLMDITVLNCSFSSATFI
jgi:hypothetical protein